jgi:ubiquinone/menaquinone biosynthesis C-methylase UbiE
MKLHIGCGVRNFGKHWIHIDGAKDAHNHIEYKDITKLHFEDNSVDIIYASHVIEYFDRSEVLDLLFEWRRVLKVGGILRLAVPDFEAMSKLYVEGKFQLSSFLGPLYGRMKLGDKMIYHKTVYDFYSLQSVLLISRFRNIDRYDWRKTEHSQEDDCSQAYLPIMEKDNGTLISLNVECIK